MMTTNEIYDKLVSLISERFSGENENFLVGFSDGSIEYECEGKLDYEGGCIVDSCKFYDIDDDEGKIYDANLNLDSLASEVEDTIEESLQEARDIEETNYSLRYQFI